MKRIIRAGVTAIGALVLLFVADRILQPVPVPAATAVLGGLIALWTGRTAPLGRVGLGILVGLLTGVGVHFTVHLTGRSPAPQEGLAAHITLNGALGLIVALLVVAVLVQLTKAFGLLGRASKPRVDT